MNRRRKRFLLSFKYWTNNTTIMEEEGIVDEQPESGNSRPTSSTSAISETQNSRPGTHKSEGLRSR